MPKFFNLPGMLLTAGTNVVTADDWSSVISAMTNQISVQTVVGVIAVVVGGGIGLVFTWWGVRKASKSLMAAFRSGKLRF